MREVTCELMKAFLEQLPAKGIPSEKGIVGTNLPLEVFLNTKERIDWDKACIIMRNGCALLGGPEKAAHEWSQQFGQHKDLRYISRVAGLFASPYLVFRLGAEWFSPLTVRNIQFKLERLSTHRLKLTVRIPATDQDSPEYLWLTYGAVPVTTTFTSPPAWVCSMSRRSTRATQSMFSVPESMAILAPEETANHSIGASRETASSRAAMMRRHSGSETEPSDRVGSPRMTTRRMPSG